MGSFESSPYGESLIKFAMRRAEEQAFLNGTSKKISTTVDTPNKEPDRYLLLADGERLIVSGSVGDEPRFSDLRIETLAHHLATVNRFAGATHTPYSVAQHSVLVSKLVPNAFALAALLHDASEAFLMDIPAPIKSHPLMMGYRVLEHRVQAAVYDEFCIPMDQRPALQPDNRNDYWIIKEADLRMLAAERRDLMPKSEAWPMLEGIVPPEDTVKPYGVDAAIDMFINRYDQIVREGGSYGRK